MPKKGRRRAQEEAAAGGQAGEPAGEEAEAEAEAPSAKKRKLPKAGKASGSAGPTEPAPPQPAEEPADDDEDEEEDEEEEEPEEEEVEDAEEAEEEEDEDGGGEDDKRIWRPGVDEIKEGEQLDVEPGTYDMLHRAQVEWPCLSFDVLRDDLGAQRTTYPMTAYVVAGTQAKEVADNRIYMMKWSRLYRTSKDGREDDDDEEDDESSGDSEDDHEAVLEYKGVPHPGGVNRVRSMPQASHIVATWADSGKVHMWNLQGQRRALDSKSEKFSANPKPIFTCEAHKQEGFAMDFNPHNTGHFLSGSNDGAIFLWEPVAGGWNVGSSSPFTGHGSSVEDVHWKRDANSGKTVFASCSSDHSVRVWDVREKDRSKAAIVVKEAHGSDVNVISWSPCVADLLVSGADDGGFKIWDTRNTAAGPMANFRWHKKPIVSVDWHPTDETVLAVGCDDDSISLWDMAVEDDAVGREGPPGADHFPAQLLFLHQGQREPKELRWHPQLPSVCVTTAGSGFNIFKTCNI